jgi:hypothetical protein
MQFQELECFMLVICADDFFELVLLSWDAMERFDEQVVCSSFLKMRKASSKSFSIPTPALSLMRTNSPDEIAITAEAPDFLRSHVSFPPCIY